MIEIEYFCQRWESIWMCSISKVVLIKNHVMFFKCPNYPKKAPQLVETGTLFQAHSEILKR